jgi:hypothetical protein
MNIFCVFWSYINRSLTIRNKHVKLGTEINNEPAFVVASAKNYKHGKAKIRGWGRDV